MLQAIPLRSIILSKQKILVRNFHRVFIVFFLMLFFIGNLNGKGFWYGFIISIMSVVPGYLWCRGFVVGLPIYPTFAITYFWGFGVPLLTNEESLQLYHSDNLGYAFFTVLMSQIFGLLGWLLSGKTFCKKPRMLVLIKSNLNKIFAWGSLFLAIVFYVWAYFFNLSEFLDQFYSLVRAAVFAFEFVSLFVMSFLLGIRKLSGTESRFFVLTVIVLLLVKASGLLLIGAATSFVIAVIGFFVGRGKFPWKVLIVAFVVFSTLQAGKSAMRKRYWQGKGEGTPLNMFSWYYEWGSYALQGSEGDFVDLVQGDIEGADPIWRRASLVRLLLLAQSKTPSRVPYLMGETYSFIPSLLIPRIFYEEKVRSHEGTMILNVRYGLQSERDTLITTIGWGMVNESYANFGIYGVIGLTFALAFLFGMVAKYSSHGTVLSFRVIWASLLLVYSMNSESSLGVFIAAWFQSSVCLFAASLVIGERRRIASPPLSRKPAQRFS